MNTYLRLTVTSLIAVLCACSSQPTSPTAEPKTPTTQPPVTTPTDPVPNNPINPAPSEPAPTNPTPVKKDPPANPSNFTAKALSTTVIRLSWEGVEGASGYSLERRSGQNPFESVADPLTTEYLDDGVSSGQTYTYRVRSVGADGSSSGLEATVTTPVEAPTPPPAQAPVSPQNFASRIASPASIELTWSLSSEGTAAEGLTLQRGQGTSPSTWSNLTLSSPLATGFRDDNAGIGLTPGRSYSYRLRTRNAVGSSDWVSLSVNLPIAARPSFRLEEIATEIGIAWAMHFDPANPNRLLYTSRNNTTLQLNTLDIQTKARSVYRGSAAVRRIDGHENGILGFVLDPNYRSNQTVYICYSYTDSSNAARNRVSSFVLNHTASSLTNERILIDRMPGNRFHNGCRLLFGPDGKLYATMGDGQYPMEAQNLGSLSGKILRINPDGSIPSDNPYSGSAVYSYGHRNAQGLAFQPGTSLLFSTEHGPQSRDELNVIRAGRNYGWPICLGTQALNSSINTPDGAYNCGGISGYTPAIRDWEEWDTIAPSNMVFYPETAAAFPAWRGSLFFVTLKTGRLYRLELQGERVASQEILIDNTQGRLRDVVVGPQGHLYISTDQGRLFRVVTN